MSANPLHLTIPISARVSSQLDAVAKSLHRSRDEVAQEAIATYLRRQEWEMDEIRKGLLEADADDFATVEEIEALNNKYKP